MWQQQYHQTVLKGFEEDPGVFIVNFTVILHYTGEPQCKPASAGRRYQVKEGVYVSYNSKLFCNTCYWMLKDPTDKRGHTNCFNKSNNFVTDEMKYVTNYVSDDSGIRPFRHLGFILVV